MQRPVPHCCPRLWAAPNCKGNLCCSSPAPCCSLCFGSSLGIECQPRLDQEETRPLSLAYHRGKAPISSPGSAHVQQLCVIIQLGLVKVPSFGASSKNINYFPFSLEIFHFSSRFQKCTFQFIIGVGKKKGGGGKHTFPVRLLFAEMWLALRKSFNVKLATGAAPDPLCSPHAGARGTSWAE